ncbi:MAG TPA: hypothetical protein VFH89_14585 [Sphingomicrobium sp.]|nr:hypothetical protein [Sphingomicrobium sp.]
MPGEVLGDRLMSETSILVDTALDDTQIQSVRQAMAGLGAAGAQPFETLTGQFEAHPFQFSGPLLVAPAADKVPAVYQHRAGAALAMVTALFRAGEVEVIAKRIE